MAITTLNSTDSGATSRVVINDNFTDVTSSLALKANLASPTFTGTPTLPTGTVAVTQSANDNSTKVATTAYVDTATSTITTETTTGATHSLTTIAGQKVVVWAKGTLTETSGDNTLTLKYNTVVKDTVVINVSPEGEKFAFALMYTETPGAATQNITVEASVGTLSNVVIIVMKIG